MAAAEPICDDVLAYYSARAEEYDKGNHHYPEREPEVDYLEQWIPTFFTGKRVLEIACGTGHWTECIAPVAQAVIATDASPNMLAVARRQCREPVVQFALADAYDLNENLGFFQAALAGFWYSHVPKSRVGDFLHSLHRRLEPGATVLLFDNSAAHSQHVPVTDRDVDGNSFQRRQLADGSTFRVLKNFPTEAELHDTIRPFGTNPQYWSLGHFWVLAYEHRS
jgi:demethylmenaquinone methyltransferase/2-methoxy-6-polyprenyl-1,4-benzoquinol methylase